MADRPTGRKKNITGTGSGMYRRGSGLNTGPVGSGSQFSAGSQNSGRRSSRGITRAGGGSAAGLIVAAVLFLLLRGGGGGSTVTDTPSSYTSSNNQSSSYSSSYSQSSQSQSYGSSGYGIPSSALESILSSGGSSSWVTSGGSAYSGSSAPTLDTSVVSGARDKYTRIVGGGEDTYTLLVYICGADLESGSGMATKDIVEMGKAALSDKVNLIIYTGGSSRWQNSVISNRSNQIYQVFSGGKLKALDDNVGNKAMTEPETLTEFIKFGTKNFPADRVSLILWDHGSGSVSGYGYDERFRSAGSMDLSEIGQALKNSGVKFDFVGFDACLMATVETGIVLEPYADYLIASEETEPGIGWYYTDWLTKLSNNTSMPTAEIGKNIVDDFVKTCQSQCSGQSATLSVVDLAELKYTVPEKLSSFSKSLSTLIKNDEYQQVSEARSQSREFARSSAIDQIDLVHFAKNMGTSEGEALADAVMGAVKYNRTSSNMNNAYGLSIYFPYRKLSQVDKAVSTYNAIGMDSSCSQCIRDFASLELSGQVSTGGSNSVMPSLFGQLYGGSGSSSGYASDDMISSLLESFLGGDMSGMSGYSSSNTGFMSDRSMSTEDTESYISEHFFDSSLLTWSENAYGEKVIVLPEEQWAQISGLELNMYYDDGQGYIDLGLDNVFDFDSDGNLLAPAERTWLAINGQFVPYYHEYTTGSVINGYVPALLNGERVKLLLAFDEDGQGRVTGARRDYVEGETDTIAKALTEINEGDTIDFICDYYAYDGSYDNSYLFGAQLVVGALGADSLEVSDMYISGGSVRITYRFTDLFQQHYWSEPLVG